MTGRVSGKVVIVAGAGTVAEGLSNGAATAVLFAREGAKVVAVDYDLYRAEETAQMIWDEGGECIPVRADVTSREDIDAMVSATLERYGGIDILFNNVGLQALGGPLDITQETWERVIATNLTSALMTIQAVLPTMIGRGGGAIVNNSSIAGIRSPYACLPYATTKAAINQLTQQVGVQHAKDGIRCNAVLPGLIDTPRVRKRLIEVHGEDIDHLQDARAQHVPSGRLGEAWDVAYAVLYLASDEAKYVNATTLVIDGGMTAA
ncbi:MAG: SDR family oxidoreductase [Brevundimonas sp.]|jgi:NAD(P)-dependent dehydrogenase (short-subunit alcohol dehydrogenase family)|uniref:SDR family NAD(P)-dependent oxidoreductase n=1 Tax=Brevundimonas sp. TaxID=1871086 RepID=UPI0025C36CA4|nr:SDR family oxidoreductase [Brevundimonas sp.]MCH4269506.1 SDR family oxidoreductase [Brevundimonas sp.]